jgi:radical SAM protein with 4Fe4S-binding SPASM domain
MAAIPVKYHKEYFGYIAGFSDGSVALLRPESHFSLETQRPFEELRSDGLLLETLEIRDGFFLNTPPLIWLELTRRCNLSCDHCYISGGNARENELSGAQFAQIIDELGDMGIWAVAFTGGEPTLHPDFSALVWHARRRGMLVGIATNGLMLTNKLLDSLPRDGVIISISLDNLHFSGHGQSKEFQYVTGVLERCGQRGFKTNIMTSTNRKNLGDLDILIAWAEEQHVSIRSVPFSPLGRGKKFKTQLELSPADAVSAARFWLRECELEHKYHQDVGLCVGSIFNYGLTLAYMTRRCSSGRYLAYIASDGTVYPCTMTAGEDIFSPGNLLETGFATLWRSHWTIRDYSWDNFQKTCAPCPINGEDYYCAARCPAMSYARHGTFSECGASGFEIASTVIRTSLLNNAEVGRNSARAITKINIEPFGVR